MAMFACWNLFLMLSDKMLLQDIKRYPCESDNSADIAPMTIPVSKGSKETRLGVGAGGS